MVRIEKWIFEKAGIKPALNLTFKKPTFLNSQIITNN